MKCPICGNKTGFTFGTCIDCGYNHIEHEFDWIKIDIKVLETLLSEEVLYYLLHRYEERYKNL
jgi:hypothetical protein